MAVAAPLAWPGGLVPPRQRLWQQLREADLVAACNTIHGCRIVSDLRTRKKTAEAQASDNLPERVEQAGHLDEQSLDRGKTLWQQLHRRRGHCDLPTQPRIHSLLSM